MDVLVLLLTAAVVLGGVFLVALMRQVGSLLLLISPENPRPVAGGPEIGSELVVPGTTRGTPTVVTFLAPRCPPCEELVPSLPVLRERYPEVELVAIVALGDDEERMSYAKSVGTFARADVPELFEEWHVQGTPFAIALDRDGRVRHRGVANTLDQLETLAEAALALPLDGMPNGLDVADNQNGLTRKRERHLA